jgi:hypothetical protein
MNQEQQDMIRCVMITAFFAAFYLVCSYLQIWRRKVWLSMLNAERSVCARLGIPCSRRFRRFGASRFFAAVNVGFGVFFLLVSVASAFLFLRFR